MWVEEKKIDGLLFFFVRSPAWYSCELHFWRIESGFSLSDLFTKILHYRQSVCVKCFSPGAALQDFVRTQPLELWENSSLELGQDKESNPTAGITKKAFTYLSKQLISVCEPTVSCHLAVLPHVLVGCVSIHSHSLPSLLLRGGVTLGQPQRECPCWSTCGFLWSSAKLEDLSLAMSCWRFGWAEFYTMVAFLKQTNNATRHLGTKE